MSIHVALRHTTHYRFDRPVNLSPHVVRLKPAAHSRTPIQSYSLKIKPAKHFINWQQDPFGNYLARLVFPERATELLIDVEVIADLTVVNPFDFFVEEYADQWPFAYPAALAKELTPYLEKETPQPLLAAYLTGIERKPQQIVDFLVDINRNLQQHIGYTIRLEPGVQSCEETLQRKLGSCRDSAWLLVQILRHLGLAARFVSGYLVQLTADEKSLDGPSGPEADFTDLHAWTEVFIPGAGWVGLDPTSGLFAGEGHIPLACTPHPSSAAPIAGFTDPCEATLAFSNTVTRFKEDPRVTKPYTEDQWTHIRALGRLVDTKLQAMDVRLTQGGEPTFVSIDDMDSPEWTIAAFGEHKRERAEVLARRLKERFATGALLHNAQGKWYPGEPLPRWALGIFWRKDGVPVWKDEQWLADPGQDYGHGIAEAQRFAETLAGHLGLAATCVQPAYEDALAALLREAAVPEHLDLAEAALRADPLDLLGRRNLASILSRGLDTPAGFVMPLVWKDGWLSAPWKFRRERLYLIQGDSPLGLRLPLNSVAVADEDKLEPTTELDPFAPPEPLADFHAQSAVRAKVVSTPKVAEVPEIPRTALCVESRDGCLYIFLPPAERLDQALDLIAAIECTCAALQLPVVIEGYAPPSDGRLEKLLVTPDPGVIEVNIHPAKSWEELEATTLTLYEEARQSRLGTEKFMLDGRHSGTGGGNHITLGGATPADSPFLRRPDLLRSMLTYWQHHPSLSYLFSGLFIGPTSQAPRVDEGRPEILYELEIAFQQLPKAGEETPQPWLVDRLFRHMLTDLTGNTHRTEFCIDKLYSPDSAAGRQGLVEFRGFEMPPHARMSLAQMLLIRALVARFWAKPYAKPLVHWGTALHDRWMMPHHLWADLRQVVAELNEAGYPFQLDWFAPFLEFRFPRYGGVQVGDIALEIRAAIEPWHVLGEEATGLGTARYVDSSIERVQVKATGLTDGRHALTCNGRRVPLANTGTHGEYIASVRYRAWQPPSAMHPTIGVHSPLVFDIVDLWNNKAIGGCTYQVLHPGGRNYDSFPVNAYEAEARRHIRFQGEGHTIGSYTPPPWVGALDTFLPEGTTIGPMAPAEEEINPEYPSTLDLRRR